MSLSLGDQIKSWGHGSVAVLPRIELISETYFGNSENHWWRMPRIATGKHNFK